MASTFRLPQTAAPAMHPVLAFPALEGMTYPKLRERDLVRVVKDPSDIAELVRHEREQVRIVMTSASRGCGIDVVEMLPNLGLIVSQGSGRERFDVPALHARGVRLRCVGEAVAQDVADLAMTFVHMLSRNLLQAERFARGGAWRQSRFPIADSVVGKTIGIGGLSGRIGQAVARRAAASEMNIVGLRRPSNQASGLTLFDTWAELAEASDVIVLAVPGTPDLRHVIGARELRALGPNGRLVNVGRGSLVDTEALIEALETGAIGGAALDVLEEEPEIPARLAGLSNVILTPHIGAQTWGQRARGARIAEDEVLDFLSQHCDA